MPTARLPLAYDIQSRKADTSKDSRLINGMIETISESEINVVKRPGVVEIPTTGATIPAEQGRGIFSWYNRILTAVGTKLFQIFAGESIEIATFDGSSQVPISWVETANDNFLVFHDGSYIYTIPKPILVDDPLVVTNQNNGSAVLSATVTNGGGWYTGVPGVTFTGGGGSPQATGTAVVYGHKVDSITIDTPGTYTGVPTITIDPPSTGSSPTFSSYYTVVGTTRYYYFSVVSGGSGYFIGQEPSVTINRYNQFGTYVGSYSGYTTVDSSGAVTSLTHNPTFTTGTIGGPDTFTYSNITPPPNEIATATANMNTTINAGPWAPGIAYLDGYVYILQKEESRIYGSAEEDPTSWNALNFISVKSDPDYGVALAKHLNYLVAFGQWSTEFFYNAGLPTPGSPLANNMSAKLEIGCANGYSVADAEQTLIWVGNSLTTGKSVYMLSGLSPIKVSTKYIDKYLNASPMTSPNSVRSYCFKIAGHTLYVLTLHDIEKTFVYDLDEKKWYQWTSQTGDTTGYDGVESYFTYTSFTGNTEYVPDIYLQGDDDGKLYRLSTDIYNDNGDLIYFRAVSPITDSGITNRKFYRRVEAVGDKVSGNLSIRHSNNDYQTWSNYRTVDLSLTRPILWRNGTGRRRAWEAFSSDSVPIRLRALELEFDIGEQGGGQEG
jgi:hypothetical protein